MKPQRLSPVKLTVLGSALAFWSSSVIASANTVSSPSWASDSGCNENYIADGDCDLSNNNEDCGGSAECVDDDDVTTNPYSESFPQTSWTTSTSTSLCNEGVVADGDCDLNNNNEDCGYDGGDCCECTCVSAAYTCGDSTHGGYACIDPSAACVNDDDATFLPPTEDFSDTLTTSTRTSSPCVTEFVGDGDCDRINNCEECGYDGGDCCECTCVSSTEFTCGDPNNGGFACVDPSAWCVDDDDVTAIPEDDTYFDFPDDDNRFPGSFSFSECIDDFISDGDCDSINNTEECDYDGGDCCECTCVSTEAYTCGAEGLRPFDCIDPSVDCDEDLVEAGTKTTITASANAYDTRPGADSSDVGCMRDGCKAELTRDGDSTDEESRWSCSPSLVTNKSQCSISFMFEEAQDIVDVEVAFWKADERSRTLEVAINGDVVGEYDSSPQSTFTAFDIQGSGVSTLTLTSVGLSDAEWLSLIEVEGEEKGGVGVSVADGVRGRRGGEQRRVAGCMSREGKRRLYQEEGKAGEEA
eukprot:jgi/Undpi1/12709/HiC_scaffold_6.g02377.m1